MALPVLDGNQSATTLSSVITGGEHIVAHTVVSLGSTAISNITSAVSGSVVSVSNFPSTQTIAGTVTANGGDFASGFGIDQAPPNKSIAIGWGSDGFALFQTASEDAPLPVQIINGALTPAIVPISGTVTANVQDSSLSTALDYYALNFNEPLPCRVFNLDGAVYSANPLAISGTVTADAPNGSLTTRFGTPTTANTAFATSAVTNANRKYLLIQNVTTGSNVITVGIGFTPTTTQGIQLTAGAGITFESSYIPTGAVYVLSSVTASNFTILEA